MFNIEKKNPCTEIRGKHLRVVNWEFENNSGGQDGGQNLQEKQN